MSQMGKSDLTALFKTNFKIEREILPLAVSFHFVAGMAPVIFQWGADSSDEGGKIWLLGYYKCQKSP